MFTLEVTLRCTSLPVNTAELATSQIGFSVADDSSRGFAAYISLGGLAMGRVDDYGSVSELEGSSDVGTSLRTTYQTIRIAVDCTNNRAYVLTGGLSVSPEVRYILPVGATPASVADRFRLTFFGTTSRPATVELLALRLSSTLELPDQPPVANAGADRVAAVGQAVRFDGRASFDLEGAPLTYLWELVDAPTGSAFAADVSSGATTDDGDADGVTTILSFTPNALPTWVAAGSVLAISGVRARVETVNNPGGSLTVAGDVLPDDLSTTPFRLFRQSFLYQSTTPVPYAVPDVTGIFRVQLTVNDGVSDSEPSEVLASAVSARAPTGIEPDVSPIWGLLGDEWQYVENRAVFEEAWRGVAQILSGKLLEVWQDQYAYSIRDVQRTYQRKWARFVAFVAESDATTAVFTPRYGVLRSGVEFEAASPSVAGETLQIQYPTENGTQTASVTFSGNSLSTIAADLNLALSATGIEAVAHAIESVEPAYRHEALLDTTDDGDSDRVTNVLNVTPGTLPSWLAAGDIIVCDNIRSRVDSFNNGTGELVAEDDIFNDDYSDKPFRLYRVCRLMLRSAVRPFSVVASTASAELILPEGLYSYRYGSGSLITSKSYFAGDGMGWDIEKGDLLVLNNGQPFRVDRVTSGPLDAYAGQRLLLLDDLPADASVEWLLPSMYRTDTDYAIECAYPGDLLRLEAHGTDDVDMHAEVVAITTTALAVIPRASFWEPFYMADDVLALGVLRRTAITLPEHVVSIPQMQDVIPVAQAPTTWSENVEYTLENFFRDRGGPVPVIQFRESTFVEPDEDPPDAFWAEFVIFDNEPAVENHFGALVGFMRDDSAALDTDFNYVAGVAGVLYAHVRGPRVSVIQTGAQVLLGQPFAEFKGTILEIREDFSPLRGRLTIRDADTTSGVPSEIVRTYYYKKDPLDSSATSGLALNPVTGVPWAVGDTVEQFALLGAGISVVDTKVDPYWYIPYVRSGIMTELEKFHTFLVEANLDLVSLVNLELLVALLHKTKPAYSHPIIVGARIHSDDLDITDELNVDPDLYLIDTLTGAGPALVYDDYRGDGSIWSSYDGGGHYDALADVPLDLIEFDLELDWAGGTITFDSIFFYDTSVEDVSGAYTGTPGTTFTPTFDMVLPAGTYIVTVPIKSTGVVV
jgi:hypothetical protein